MSQTTSELWKKLWETKNTHREYKFEINGVEYGEGVEVSQSVTREQYSELGFGNATTAKLTLSIFADNIPRGATIKRFVRLVNGSQVSEWLASGVFFINRRSEEDGLWNIEAYDVMRKAEQEWIPRDDLVFPLSMPDAVEEFAQIMGCEIDPRTVLNPAYTIDYPASGTTIRQEFQYIGAAHGGNWIVTGEGKLLLIPLGSAPPETHYLVTKKGRAITLGGVRILV